MSDDELNNALVENKGGNGVFQSKIEDLISIRDSQAINQELLRLMQEFVKKASMLVDEMVIALKAHLPEAHLSKELSQ